MPSRPDGAADDVEFSVLYGFHLMQLPAVQCSTVHKIKTCVVCVRIISHALLVRTGGVIAARAHWAASFRGGK